MDESSGDREWQQWLVRYGPQFLLLARQKARCEADAQDLVQEAVLESAQRCREGVPPPALVFATIHRRAVDWARREDRRARRELIAAEGSQSPWFDAAVEDRERAQVIQEALNRLPEIYREVIVLKVWGDLTFAEIATTLGIPANTAASRYRYGIAELRKAQVLA